MATIILNQVRKTENYRKHVAIVDDDDFVRLNKERWCISMGYAVRRSGGKIIKMHQIVIGSGGRQVVDHINRNKLDNRKSNLRIANHSINSINRNNPKNNTSGRKGVCWDKRKNRWKAYIKLNQVMKNLGRFKNKNDAINARISAEKKYHGIN
jgi:hypothetical protein